MPFLKRNQVVNYLNPSDLSRLIVMQEYTISVATTNDEPVPIYADKFVCSAKKKAHRSKNILDNSVSDVALNLVFWTLPYIETLRTATYNFESFRLIEIIGTPTYLLTTDLYGNFFVDLTATSHLIYDIIGVEDLGLNWGYELTTQLIR